MSLKTRVARLEAKVPSLREWIASLSDEELDREIERSRAREREHVARMTDEEFAAFIADIHDSSCTWGPDLGGPRDENGIEPLVQWYMQIRCEVTASKQTDPDELAAPLTSGASTRRSRSCYQGSS